jgi:hypothetical protein
MKALKLSVTLTGLLVAIQYSAVYYSSIEYNAFVKEAALHTRLKDTLKDELLDKAKTYSLPIMPGDIAITTTGPIFRVAVNYSVPVNLLICNPELKFQALGSGLLRNNPE